MSYLTFQLDVKQPGRRGIEYDDSIFCIEVNPPPPEKGYPKYNLHQVVRLYGVWNHPFIAITPKFTRILYDNTCLYSW